MKQLEAAVLGFSRAMLLLSLSSRCHTAHCMGWVSRLGVQHPHPVQRSLEVFAATVLGLSLVAEPESIEAWTEDRPVLSCPSNFGPIQESGIMSLTA